MTLVLLGLEKTFKGFSEEHRMMKLNELISLSEGRTNSAMFSIDWTKSFEGVKSPHRKQDFVDSKNEFSKCCKTSTVLF